MRSGPPPIRAMATTCCRAASTWTSLPGTRLYFVWSADRAELQGAGGRAKELLAGAGEFPILDFSSPRGPNGGISRAHGGQTDVEARKSATGGGWVQPCAGAAPATSASWRN